MSNAIIGALRVVFGADTAAFEKGTDEVERRMAKTQKGLEKTASKFTDLGGKLTLGLTAPLTAFGVTAFKAASDAAELQSAFNQTFGSMAASMTKWAEETGNAMGRSTQEMQKAANTFGIFFNTAVDPAKAAAMSQTFATLAQDLGSFYNTDTETAIEKLRSGLSGESEPLRDFGVFLTEASVKAKAMEMGLAGVGNELTEQEKILARYQLIMEATKNAQGDVARTSDGTANRVRAMQSAFSELQVAIGEKLLPAFTPIITALTAAIEAFTSLPEPVQNVSIVLAGVAAVVGPLLIGIGGMVSGFSALLPVLTSLGPVLVVVKTAMLGLLTNPVFLGAAAAIVGIYLAWKNWDKIKEIVAGLYNAVKTWIIDRLGAVWKTVTDKIDSVKRAFFNLYDAVVGHSYIPDMVDGIAAQMLRLDAVMVNQAVSATTKTKEAFRKLAADVQPLLDRLFPEAAALNKYRAEMQTIARAQAGGVLSPDQAEEARRRLNREGTSDASAIPLIMSSTDLSQVSADVISRMDELVNKTNDAARRSGVATVQIAKSFKDMATETTNALQSMANAIQGGGFLDILSSVVNLGLQLGSVGAFGKKIQTNINTPQARAIGGNVSTGRSYIVGERGPELFTPASSGAIMANKHLSARGGGGNTYVLKGNLMTPEFWQMIQNGNVAAAQAGGEIGFQKVAYAGTRRIGQ